MCLCVCVAGPCLTRTNPYHTHSHTARARASATVNEAFRPEVILAALAMAQSFSSQFSVLQLSLEIRLSLCFCQTGFHVN